MHFEANGEYKNQVCLHEQIRCMYYPKKKEDISNLALHIPAPQLYQIGYAEEHVRPGEESM